MKKAIKQITILGLITVLVLFTLTACARNTAETSNMDKPDKLVIAYLPNEADEKLTEVRQGFGDDLSKAIGVPVEEFKTTDYNATIEALRAGKADMALLGPLTIVQALDRVKLEPIGLVAKDGKKENSGYKSYLVTNTKNVNINSIKDIKGCTVAFVDPGSTSGNLIPSAEIIKAFPDLDLTMDDIHTNDKFFKAVSYSGKHQAGLQAVSKGDIDLVPCASETYETEISSGRVDGSTVKIIHTSSTIPSSAFVIRADYDQEMKGKIKEFLLSYANEKYFEEFLWDKSSRFIECNIEDYNEIKELSDKLFN